MSTCFIIQPFDRGAFDKRYEQVMKPAIQAASLEPYRVDEDLDSSILVEAIHRGIEEASVCLADITPDNPNVWYEIGYAIASRKEVVMICNATRKQFPFDVQHRNIVIYQAESPADFAQLQQKITKRLQAALLRQPQSPAVQPIDPTNRGKRPAPT
jgi:nucleoside 2-deoxyribosyltransferase